MNKVVKSQRIFGWLRKQVRRQDFLGHCQELIVIYFRLALTSFMMSYTQSFIFETIKLI